MGDVVAELENRADSGQVRILFDNVHSEFLNMLVPGVPAPLLFSAFVLTIAWVDLTIGKRIG